MESQALISVPSVTLKGNSALRKHAGTSYGTKWRDKKIANAVGNFMVIFRDTLNLKECPIDLLMYCSNFKDSDIKTKVD